MTRYRSSQQSRKWTNSIHSVKTCKELEAEDMKGFPKHLNSKQDYIYIRENFPDEQWKPVWQGLLGGQKNWFCVGKLDSKEAGITDSTHKIIESVNQQEAKTE